MRKNIVIAISVIIFLIIISYVIYLAIDRNGKVAITVNVLPQDALVTFNGKDIGKGTVYVVPGTYSIKASKSGFADFTASEYLDHSGQIVTLLLDAQTVEAKKWMQDHQDTYAEFEGKAGEQANTRGDDFQKKNPITGILPYSNLIYTIGYKADPADPSGNSIIIEIDASDGYRQSALFQITQWGYNPADFKINFRNYKNPFAP